MVSDLVQEVVEAAANEKVSVDKKEIKMKIEILGTGCPKCKKLFEAAQQATTEAGIEAELVKVTDLKDIMSYGVMVTPALVIGNEVKAAGRVPSVEEIKGWIKK